MQIRVADKNFGECVVNTNNPLEKTEEYVIKGLCFLQLLVMNKFDNPDKFKKLLETLTQTIDKLNKLYNDDEQQNADPTACFDD